MGLGIMTTPSERFVQNAHPHSWMLVAENLYEHAAQVRAASGRQYLTLRTDTSIEHQDLSWRPTFLLSALAIENSIKAFLVFENPNWISNGTLAKPLRSHRLNDLVLLSDVIPYRGKNKNLLSKFESGIESFGRYPCGVDVRTTFSVPPFGDYEWAQFQRLIRSHGRRMKRLLQDGWYGPHGQSGSFCFSGEFFAFGE